MFYCNAIVWYIILTDRKEWPKNVITVYIPRYIRTLSSYHLLSALLNWFILVYGLFGQSNMQARKESNEPRLKSS